MAGGHLASWPAFAPPERYEDLGDKMRVEQGNAIDLDHDPAITMPVRVHLENLPGGRLEGICQRGGLSRKPHERRHGGWVVPLSGRPENLVPEKIPGDSAIGVGSILAPWLALGLEEGSHHDTRHSEKRPHQCHSIRERPRTPHARQSGRSGATKESVQHGLRLIIGRMPDGDVAGGTGPGRRLEKLISQPTGEPLAAVGIGHTADGNRPGDELQTEPVSKGGDEPPVIGCLLPQIVFGMRNDTLAGGGRPKSDQPQQQGDAVGPP